MRKNNNQFFLSVCLFILASLTLILRGHCDSSLVRSFIIHGASQYNQGYITEALNDFSRALLLDPHNEKAQGYLFQLKTHNSLNGQTKIKIYRLEDTAADITRLKGLIDYYQFKKICLINNLIRGGYEKSKISNEMKMIDKTSPSQSDIDSYREKLYDPEITDPLDMVSLSLDFEKKKLNEKLLYVQYQLVRLKDIHRMNLSQLDYNLSSPLEQNVYSRSENFYTKDGVRIVKSETKVPQNAYVMLKEQESEIDALKNEMESLRTRLEEFRLILDNKNKKLSDLTQQLINATLQLVEKDKIIQNNVNDLSSYNNELADVQSRLNLGQKIIEDKEGEILKLKNNLRYFNTTSKQRLDNLRTRLLDKNLNLVELQGILDIYRNKFRDSHGELKQKNAHIKTLEEQLNLAQKNLFEKNKTFLKLKDDVIFFEEKLKDLQKQIKEDKDKKPLLQSHRKDIDSEIRFLKARLKETNGYLIQAMQKIPPIL